MYRTDRGYTRRRQGPPAPPAAPPSASDRAYRSDTRPNHRVLVLPSSDLVVTLDLDVCKYSPTLTDPVREAVSGRRGRKCNRISDSDTPSLDASTADFVTHRANHGRLRSPTPSPLSNLQSPNPSPQVTMSEYCPVYAPFFGAMVSFVAWGRLQRGSGC